MEHPTGKQNATSLTDSPWFWAYVFSTGGLIALLIAGPRYVDRQTQLDRQFTARQRAGQIIVGSDGPVPLQEPGRTLIPLQPLGWMMALILCSAWGAVIWRRSRNAPATLDLTQRASEEP